MPKCRVCLTDKESTLFPVNKSYKTGHATVCKMCSASIAKKYREEHAAKYKANKFKASEEDVYHRLKTTSCDICGSPPKAGNKYLAIDHCHTTGKLRGMLCDLCNTALGKFKDSEELLSKAILYLRKHSVN